MPRRGADPDRRWRLQRPAARLRGCGGGGSGGPQAPPRGLAGGEPGRRPGKVGWEAIEATGAECWIGTPDRLATLRAALDSVTILCWLLGSAAGAAQQLRELHSSRLQFFLTQAIDTTVRGFVYEARGAQQELLSEGGEIARALAERNAIPARVLTADPND